MPLPLTADVSLNLVQTFGLAGLMFLLGVLLKRKIPVLDRLNIPAAVIGGLLFALAALAAHDRLPAVRLDTSAQTLLMVSFFTTIGMNASLPLLRSGGMPVLVFLLLSSLFCVVQNAAGILTAGVFGAHPLLGVMAGSVTLVGGPATGLAFAKQFAEAGLVGADTVAIAAATFGIVCGGLLGGPVATRIIRRRHLDHPRRPRRGHPGETREGVEAEGGIVVDVDGEYTPFVRNMILLGVVMGIGSLVSMGIEALGMTLPIYIGAMLVASVARNIDDRTSWFRIDTGILDFVGTLALNAFLVIALMNLRLWELAALALPLLTILAVQAVLVVAFTVWVVYRMMGRDYDAAVMTGGFIGFVLGTTANALANMKSVTERHGAAPRAFLVVPLVGAFFIDFVNAVIITFFLNWLR
jgi:glutamate:Na+ symporter, ESS family